MSHSQRVSKAVMEHLKEALPWRQVCFGPHFERNTICHGGTAYLLRLSRSGSREETVSSLWCCNPPGQPPSISFLPPKSPLLQSLQFSRIIPQLQSKCSNTWTGGTYCPQVIACLLLRPFSTEMFIGTKVEKFRVVTSFSCAHSRLLVLSTTGCSSYVFMHIAAP